ncbi:MAG: hypothetical protein ACJ74H_08690 [Thermoanaerobaculia bacterium]
MSRPVPEGKLFYHGTDVEVRLGDRVEWKRWLRKPLRGTVAYIPGISPFHEEMQELDGKLSQWAIRFEDGSLVSWLYTPDVLQPEKGIKFIGRGDPDAAALLPDEELT